MREAVALMYSGLLGGMGMFGVLCGIEQFRAGPVVVGVLMMYGAWCVYKLFMRAL